MYVCRYVCMCMYTHMYKHNGQSHFCDGSDPGVTQLVDTGGQYMYY
jgi:hypothetical protein